MPFDFIIEIYNDLEWLISPDQRVVNEMINARVEDECINHLVNHELVGLINHDKEFYISILLRPS